MYPYDTGTATVIYRPGTDAAVAVPAARYQAAGYLVDVLARMCPAAERWHLEAVERCSHRGAEKLAVLLGKLGLRAYEAPWEVANDPAEPDVTLVWVKATCEQIDSLEPTTKPPTNHA